jgi:hypothetical protein
MHTDTANLKIFFHAAVAALAQPFHKPNRPYAEIHEFFVDSACKALNQSCL